MCVCVCVCVCIRVLCVCVCVLCKLDIATESIPYEKLEYSLNYGNNHCS